MEEFTLPKEINIYTITAKSFPEEIGEVHHRLHKLLPPNTYRNSFGISHPENGKIIYKAGAEVFKNDNIDLKIFEPFTIQSGTYISILINDFRNNLSQIDTAFKNLTSQKNIDPDGYCIEFYFNLKDVRCMIKTI